jgi:hypothetical protein
MKKWLIILLIFILLILFAGLSVLGYYLWDNSESTIRGRIEKAYYDEMSYEGCELNNYKTFPSKESCLRAIECTSKEISEAIESEHLKDFNKEIKAKRSIEVMVSENLDSSFIYTWGIMEKCLAPNGWNATI